MIRDFVDRHTAGKSLDTNERIALRRRANSGDALDSARAKMGQESYEAVRSVLKTREPLYELAKESAYPRAASSHMARQYLKAALTEPSLDAHAIEKIYEQRLMSNNTLKPTHALRMQAVALGRAVPRGAAVDDVILAHTYCPDDRLFLDSRSETAVDHAADCLAHLCNHPTTKGLMQTLAAVMQEHGTHIYLSPSPANVRFFFPADSASPGSTMRGAKYKNAIYCANFGLPGANGEEAEAVAVLVHEIVHALVDKLFDNGAVPVKTLQQAAEYEQAIFQDIAHRNDTDRFEGEDSYEASKRQYMKRVCDVTSNYFPAGFQIGNPDHHRLLGIESIVRPMQLLATTFSEHEVQSVAPHVWRYYQEQVAPVFAAYAQKAIDQGSIGTQLPNGTRDMCGNASEVFKDRYFQRCADVDSWLFLCRTAAVKGKV